MCALLLVDGTRAARAAEPAPATRQSFREGRGPTVVMLGGGVYGAAMFATHARALAPEFDVIRIQTLNVQLAESGGGMPEDYSVTSEAEAIERTLRELNVEGPVDLVGSSFGGVVALRVATLHPERVRSLVLFEPPAFWALTEEERSGDPQLVELLALTRGLTPSVTPTDAQLHRFRCLLATCTAIPAPSDPSRAEWDRSRRSMRGLAAVQLHAEDPRVIRTLPQPVLLVRGSESVVFHRRVNERLAGMIPNVESVAIPGTHTAARTAEGEFLEQVRRFIHATSLRDFQSFLGSLDAAQLRLQNGDAAAYKAHWSHRDDVTLIGGFGGAIEKGWEAVGRRLDWAATQFSRGTSAIERVTTAVNGDFAYVVQFERIRFTVPGQTVESSRDYRVTMIFRREAGEWKAGHRHADVQTVKAPVRK